MDSLPFVHDLCHQLGYGDPNPHGPRHRILTQSTRHWREIYVSDDMIPGIDIRDGVSKKGKQDLKAMAQTFLECGYGEKHWSSNGRGEL